MATKEDDYTKYRTTVSGVNDVYTIDSKIGRRDYQKYELMTTDPATASGTAGAILR